MSAWRVSVTQGGRPAEGPSRSQGRHSSHAAGFVRTILSLSHLLADERIRIRSSRWRGCLPPAEGLAICKRGSWRAFSKNNCRAGGQVRAGCPLLSAHLWNTWSALLGLNTLALPPGLLGADEALLLSLSQPRLIRRVAELRNSILIPAAPSWGGAEVWGQSSLPRKQVGGRCALVPGPPQGLLLGPPLLRG